MILLQGTPCTYNIIYDLYKWISITLQHEKLFFQKLFQKEYFSDQTLPGSTRVDSNAGFRAAGGIQTTQAHRGFFALLNNVLMCLHVRAIDRLPLINRPQ